MSSSTFLSLFLLLATPLLVWSLKVSDDFEVTWVISGKNKTAIEFTVVGKTLGYVGLGFKEGGEAGSGMKGADIVMGGFNASNGASYFGDYHADPAKNSGSPLKDKIQNYELISASENQTHTILKFSRILDTCDPDDAVLPGKVTHFLWALGVTDDIKQHASRGFTPAKELTDFITKSMADGNLEKSPKCPPKGSSGIALSATSMMMLLASLSWFL